MHINHLFFLSLLVSLCLSLILLSLFLCLSIPLLLPPRNVCEDSLRAGQGEGLHQHLSVELSPTATRTVQRGARGAAPVGGSQRLQSSHEPWRATHRNGQQYVTKARDAFS